MAVLELLWIPIIALCIIKIRTEFFRFPQRGVFLGFESQFVTMCVKTLQKERLFYFKHY